MGWWCRFGWCPLSPVCRRCSGVPGNGCGIPWSVRVRDGWVLVRWPEGRWCGECVETRDGPGPGWPGRAAGVEHHRRSVYHTVGWAITDADETAIAALPAGAWDAGLDQDGQVDDQEGVAELTGLSTRPGWPAGQRLIVRRTRPAGRHRAKLTAFERATGWRYAIVATNITRIPGVGGSHQPQWLDVLHRAHAGVEDRVRTGKAMGTAPPALQRLDHQPRLGTGRQPCLRPGRLDPPAGPARPTRPSPRRTRHPALPPVAPPRPAGQPRPPPLVAHRHHLALGRGLHHLLATAPSAALNHLSGPSATTPEGEHKHHRSTGTRRPRSDARRHPTTPQGTNRARQVAPADSDYL
jgi:hypothetical protein